MQPELVLLDLSTPRRDGLGRIGRLREEPPALGIVALSGSGRRRLDAIAQERGATGLLGTGCPPTDGGRPA